MHHVRAIAIILFTLTVASASVATSLRAQSIAEFAAIKPAANSGAIDGTVIDTSGNGLAGVEVLILDNKQSVRTNGGGAYRIAGVEPGSHIMRFRRLGLQPVTLTVDVAANDVTGADVVMGSVHQLSTVQVMARSGDIMVLPSEFVQHMRTGMGHYMTQEDIEKRHALSTAELFSNIPGVTVRHGSTPGSIVVASARGVNSIWADPCTQGIPMYLNGFQTVGSGGTPGSAQQNGLTETVSRAPLHSLNVVAPSEIAGIEIYAGVAGLPATIPPSVCGAIVIWTK